MNKQTKTAGETAKGKTLLEALNEAIGTGTIAISTETATVLTHMMQLEQAVCTICNDLTSQYDGMIEAQDQISNHIFNAYKPLQRAIRSEVGDFMQEHTFSFIEFKGI